VSKSRFVQRPAILPAVKRRSIAIVGAGRLGTVLALQLHRPGYEIAEIVARNNRRSLSAARKLARKVGAKVSTRGQLRLDANLVWFCVPDAEIAKAASQLSERDWKGKTVFHSSGVLTSDVLDRLREKGAQVASVHPLMTFVQGAMPDLAGVTFALEGDALAMQLARRVVRDLKGEVIQLRVRDKVAYHAFATMICPLLVSFLMNAEQIAARAGIPRVQARRRMLPIIQQTLTNYANLGPANAFSGPIVRGDVGTIRQHLEVLSTFPVARNVYVVLAHAALEALPSDRKKEISDLLRKVSLSN
jgi:predicted short-subunit dehydrogenase-like oxidoreductase (DUF2520 family)